MKGLGLLLLAVVGRLHSGVVIDRVAVIVGKHVIKLSDIDLDLRVTEFLNRQPLDVSADARRKSAERLIEQSIIRGEIATGGYRRASDSDAGALLANLRRDRFHGSDAQMRAALSRYALTEFQLESHFLWQLTVLRFIDQRFRPGVLVSDDEVRAYYDAHLAELREENPQNSSFDALAPRIRGSLEGEQINQNFAEAMDAARKGSHVRYLQEAFL
jgi:peptidyl-prolyl cis-trans isomerase SurA